MLQAWNFVLVIAASLTILGTFLTRSGVVASVHSFTQSAIGPVLLGFLVVVLAASLGLFAARAHLVASAPRLESLASREGAFLLNNLLLSVFARGAGGHALPPAGRGVQRGRRSGWAHRSSTG